jgi:hypothetical protein
MLQAAVRRSIQLVRDIIHISPPVIAVGTAKSQTKPLMRTLG